MAAIENGFPLSASIGIGLVGYGIHDKRWRKLRVISDRCQFVTCPCPDREEAGRIGGALVGKGLAAAVNIVSQDSVYRWRGQVREAREYLLIIKGPRNNYELIERTILDMHSYELPGIAAVPLVDGFEPYLEWIGRGGAG